MKRIYTVFLKDFKELRRSKDFRIIVIIFILITTGTAGIVSLSLNHPEWLREETSLIILKLVISLIIYFITLAAPMTTIWAFGSIPVAKEKVNGNIDSLLSTPLNPKTIWMAKSLAIFLPGWIIGMASTSIIILTIHGLVIKPITGQFVLPSPILFIGLFTNPLLFFGLTILTLLIALAYHPDAAIAPVLLIGFGLMIGIPVGLALHVIDLTSWTFAIYNLAGTILVWITIVLLGPLMTKEKITLSSKGE